MFSAPFGPIRVSWHEDDLCVPLGKLLGGFVSSSERGDIHVAVTGRNSCAPPAGRQIFSLGVPKAHAEGDDVLIYDGHSSARISNSGSEIALHFVDGALAEGEAFRAHSLPGALTVAARAHGYFHMHAAVMRLDGAGIIVSGDGHAGKSTVATCLLESGAEWGTDDIALFGRVGGAPAIWGVPRAFHLRPRTAEMFPSIRSAGKLSTGYNDESRWEVDLSTALSGRQLRSAVLPKLIVFPKIVATGETAISPVESAEAVARLMMTSALVIVEALGRQIEQLSLLAEMVSSADCYELTLGPDALVDVMLPAHRIRAVLNR
ncbi:MAG: hypothetical protein ACJAYU_003252 [Bradymonadia bacterium]|jgi:hypothetical protein